MRRNFDRMDRDGDGYLEPSEIEALIQRNAGCNRPSGGLGGLTRWDSDGDGQLSIEEIPRQLERRFDQLDTNRDGLLDQAELSAMRGRGRGPGGRGNGN
jgi:Ca2+-binding EF-hand superfamily protein